ncbi:hypothetical protein PR048_022863 [Dryococelus australis]|uniref:Carboxylesterase type B domain-containing protein n=1 Tax=Dryococelus australis TaxID=614101 RepID=A0ABQ9GSG9_9NEOP|nr:hypothetical protein PR048_022863 [Dryococelus australis]
MVTSCSSSSWKAEIPFSKPGIKTNWEFPTFIDLNQRSSRDTTKWLHAGVSGLFQRAILMSGSPLSSWAVVEDPVSYALQLARLVNCSVPDDLPRHHDKLVDCLRAVPLEELLSADVRPPSYLAAFGPSVDGVVVATDLRRSVCISASSYLSPHLPTTLPIFLPPPHLPNPILIFLIPSPYFYSHPHLPTPINSGWVMDEGWVRGGVPRPTSRSGDTPAIGVPPCLDLVKHEWKYSLPHPTPAFSGSASSATLTDKHVVYSAQLCACRSDNHLIRALHKPCFAIWSGEQRGERRGEQRGEAERKEVYNWFNSVTFRLFAHLAIHSGAESREGNGAVSKEVKRRGRRCNNWFNSVTFRLFAHLAVHSGAARREGNGARFSRFPPALAFRRCSIPRWPNISPVYSRVHAVMASADVCREMLTNPKVVFGPLARAGAATGGGKEKRGGGEAALATLAALAGTNRCDLLFGVVTGEALWRFSSAEVQSGFEGAKRDRMLRTYVRNTYSFHVPEIFFTLVNEYTDWERTVLHPVNTRDATAAALGDAEFVAPLVQLGDVLSYRVNPAASSSKHYFYVFDYQTRDSDYPR